MCNVFIYRDFVGSMMLIRMRCLHCGRHDIFLIVILSGVKRSREDLIRFVCHSERSRGIYSLFVIWMRCLHFGRHDIWMRCLHCGRHDIIWFVILSGVQRSREDLILVSLQVKLVRNAQVRPFWINTINQFFFLLSSPIFELFFSNNGGVNRTCHFKKD